jgi:hypothetical protein
MSTAAPTPAAQSSQEIALKQYAPVLSYMATECSMFWSRSQLFLVANSALIGLAAKEVTTLSRASPTHELSIYLGLSICGISCVRSGS